MPIADRISELKSVLPEGVELVAVSKTYPPSVVQEAYEAGQRVFGENRPQELVAKYNELPKDIRWHLIGGLQTNKVKYIAPFVEMIHSGESARLLDVIDKEARRNGRVIDVLLEIHIGQEPGKHGWEPDELLAYLGTGVYRNLEGVRLRGLMGVATFTDDTDVVQEEFNRLRGLFDRLRREFFDEHFDTLSMGMTGDFRIAVGCGSTMVRIGSYIFGARG